MTTHTDTITIPTWANGPDDSGNGGWSAGLLAQRLDPDAMSSGVAVSLRVPPPLGRPLDVVEVDGGVELRDGDVLVAHASRSPVEFEVPDTVRGIDPSIASTASAEFPFRDRHPFPRCVSCGIARGEDEVCLDLHCGPVAGVEVAGSPVFADTWRPFDDVVDPLTPPPLASIAATWSALDCPSAAPIADPDATHPIVLARIAARIDVRPHLDDTFVLAAWHVSSDGRKHATRSVLLDSEGHVFAAADALWIEVRPR